MDAMALLCTLHADGPATLKRLRQAGCSTLEALEVLDAERIASLLACTPASARRLQKEARGLRERLHGGAAPATTSAAAPVPGRAASEPARSSVESAAHSREAARVHEEAGSSAIVSPCGVEDGVQAAASPRAPLPSEPAPVRAALGGSPHEAALDTRSSHSAASPGESLAYELPAREKRLVQRVVEAWRARDAEDASVRPEPDARLARVRPEERGEELAVVPPSELGTPLRPQDLDGLDAELTARLSALGVGSLEALARVDAVELAQRVPIGYSRLARLVALARRALPSVREPHRAEAFAARAEALEPAKISRSELPFALKRPEVALDLPDGLKRTPGLPPKDRPTSFEAEREGAGGPFV
ncbi:MAG: hypothetical protein IPJ77_14240 [Planctomycetes bacterium]|nr:hypothetical protein [Planctomycetota bacterium]